MTGVAVAGTLAGCTSSPWESTGAPAGADQATPTDESGTAADWPMAEADAGNTAALTDSSGPSEPVGRRWSFQGAGGFETAPAVVDGLVYATTDGNRVYAVAEREGGERWRGDGGEKRLGPPAVSRNRVHAVAAGHRVHAWDRDTGEAAWQFRMGPETRDWVESAPTVAAGTVYVGGTDRTLYALDATSGEKRWQFQQGGLVPLTPAVGEETVYTTARRDRAPAVLYAVDATAGTERWRSTLDVPDRDVSASASPTIGDGSVYIGIDADNPRVTHTASGRIYSLAPDDGSEQWRVDTESPVAHVATDGETVYVQTASPSQVPEGALLALDAVDGGQRWRLQTRDGVHGPLAVVGDRLYALWYTGHRGEPHLRALEATAGTVLWTHGLDFSPEALAVLNGTAFVTGPSGVYALE